MKTTLRLLLLAALFALAACGTKGALVLPDKPDQPAPSK
jgi:predicted small lipoprotein YifL